MSKNSSPSVQVPSYSAPDPASFSSPTGSVNYANGGFNFSAAPGSENDASMIEGLRNALLMHLGVTNADQNAALDNWQKTYADQVAKTAIPQYENALSDRGLLGSSIHQGGLTDLVNKINTDAYLKRNDLQTQDLQNQLATLSGILGVQNQDQGNAYNLLNLASNYATNQGSQATSRYNTTVPYLAQVTGGKRSNGAGLGSLAGLALGALAAIPTGGLSLAALPGMLTSGAALGGASLGGALGGMF